MTPFFPTVFMADEMREPISPLEVGELDDVVPLVVVAQYQQAIRQACLGRADTRGQLRGFDPKVFGRNALPPDSGLELGLEGLRFQLGPALAEGGLLDLGYRERPIPQLLFD
jgi:hypothetical protein